MLELRIELRNQHFSDGENRKTNTPKHFSASLIEEGELTKSYRLKDFSVRLFRGNLGCCVHYYYCSICLA